MNILGDFTTSAYASYPKDVLFYRKIPSKERSEPDTRCAATVEAAELALDRFAQSWEARYPMSVAAWRKHWYDLTTFFKYPVELRRMIYTTNAIESLHSQMRKNISNRKMFPNDEAVIKILFLNIRNFSNRWTRRQGWDIVMNQLAVMFGDRLKPEITDAL